MDPFIIILKISPGSSESGFRQGARWARALCGGPIPLPLPEGRGKRFLRTRCCAARPQTTRMQREEYPIVWNPDGTGCQRTPPSLPLSGNGTSLVIRKLSMGPTFYAPRVGATGPRMKG